MAFGTRNRMAWIPAPQSVMDTKLNRALNQVNTLTGQQAWRSRPRTYKSWSFNYMSDRAVVQPLLDMLDEADGPPFYFMHPANLIQSYNALPPHWAGPAAFMRAGDPLAYVLSGAYRLLSVNRGFVSNTLVTGTPAGNAPTKGIELWASNGSPPFKDYGYPDGGAEVFAWDTSGDYPTQAQTPPSATVIIPPGYNGSFNCWANVIAGAPSVQIYKRVSDADGVFANTYATDAPTEYTTWGTAVAIAGSTVNWTVVDIVLNVPSNATPTHVLDLFGMVLYVTKIGTTPPVGWSRGRGQMPLFLAEDGATISVYQAFDKEFTGAAVTMAEGFIGW